MHLRIFCALGVMALAAGSQSAFPQSNETLRQLDALDRKCEAARDAALPAIREAKIAECVQQPPSPRARARTLDECQRYWGDFGVMQQQRAALKLPVCEEAFLARKQYRSR